MVRVEDVNATLRHLYGDSVLVPRPAWNRLICKRYGIGIEMAHKLTQTGATLGYWIQEKAPQIRNDQGHLLSQPGQIRFLPQTVPQPTTPTGSESAVGRLVEPTTNPSLTAAA